MRRHRVRRWVLGLGLAAVVLMAILAAPVAYVETACLAPRSAHEAEARATSALVIDEPRYRRPEATSYLSFPEWYIVYAYEDLAAVLQAGDPSDFAYGTQIAGFWRSLCGVTRTVSARAEAPFDTKLMLYTIGWSFTVELALKGAYETTVGRVFEWLRGAEKTPEDRFIENDAAAYAEFLRQTPWYAYPFADRLGAFWRETPFRGRDIARKIERRIELTLEYGIKAAYAQVIRYATATALGEADRETRAVVRLPDPTFLNALPRLRVLRDLGEGQFLVIAPRYRAFTEILTLLARKGGEVVEIAGNDDILVTVLSEPGAATAPQAMRRLFSVPVQSRPGWERVGYDVRVPLLAAAIRALDMRGIVLEHVYDY